MTAEQVARLYFDEIFRLHGLPSSIVSDRDPKFTGAFWQSLFTLTGTKLLLSTSYHPQTDGQTERLNRTLEEMLRSFVAYDMRNWDDLLPAVEFAYNSAVQASTRLTPFYMNYGFEPRSPLGLLAQPAEGTSPDASHFLAKIQDAVKLATSNLETAQKRQAHYYDQRHRHVTFSVGDKVLVSSEALQTAAERDRPSDKLSALYTGPLEVLQVISPLAYRVRLPAGSTAHDVVSVKFLQPYQEDPAGRVRPVHAPQPQPLLHDEQGEPLWEVGSIRRAKTLRDGTKQYLVHWRGFPRSKDSWEPEVNVAHTVALQQYLAKQAKRVQRKSHATRT